MTNYLLAHDLGTSGDKVTLFDEYGTLIKETTMSYPTDYFNSNWAEQNPDDWWEAVCKGTRIVIKDIEAKQICAVSFSGHMMGCLCVDEHGLPLRPSIIWSDQRSESEFRELTDRSGEDKIYSTTGHRGSANYTLPKIMWVKKHDPEMYHRTFKILQCKDYIIYKLTNKFVTEPTDGVGTLAMDIRSHQWSDELLAAARIDKEKFPNVLKSTEVAGTVTRDAAAVTGLCEGTRVVMGGGDGVMAAIGTGAIRPGHAFMSLGSSAWVSAVSEKPMLDSQRRTTNSPHVIDGLYLNEGVMQSAGVSYAWAKKVLGGNHWNGIENVNDYIGDMVAKTPAGSNGVMFLPYLMGERCPWWNPNAKGAFLGVKMETSNADMLRAVMEGVGHNMGYISEILRENGARLQDVTVVGGGARGLEWRQILSDCMNVNIHVPVLLEGATSFGAAIVGGIGTGLYRNYEEAVEKFIRLGEENRPEPEQVSFYAGKREIFIKCYKALESLCEEFN